MISTTDIHWSAGLIDGEGSFFLNTKSASPRVSAQMADEDTIRKLHRIWGGCVYFLPRRKSHWSDMWVWTLNGRRAAGVMMTLYVLMSARRKAKIESVIVIWRTFGR
mgnify:FL=1